MRRSEQGSALVVVLLAIALLLPPTLVLSALAMRWQRQSLDFRDATAEEFAAESGLERARYLLAAEELKLEPGEGRELLLDGFPEMHSTFRVSRQDDVVLSSTGDVLEGLAAEDVELEAVGMDPEGRVVYRFRKIEIYLVEVEVFRRLTLPSVRLYGALARLPDGNVSTLGVTRERYFAEAED